MSSDHMWGCGQPAAGPPAVWVVYRARGSPYSFTACLLCTLQLSCVQLFIFVWLLFCHIFILHFIYTSVPEYVDTNSSYKIYRSWHFATCRVPGQNKSRKPFSTESFTLTCILFSINLNIEYTKLSFYLFFLYRCETTSLNVLTHWSRSSSK
jgi:hypothetical protein